MQLRQKLFLVLSLMATVPLLFLLLEVVERVERGLEARAGSELHKTLAKMSQEIGTLMDTQKSLVRGLAKVPLLREFANVLGDPDDPRYETKAAELSNFFVNYQSSVPSIQAVRFTASDGKTLVKAKEGHIIPPKLVSGSSRGYVEDIAYKPFFQHALASRQPVSISDFERGKAAGEVDFCPAMVRYSVPIRDDLDTVQGLLTVNMWGRRVDDAVEATLGGYPGKAYIVELNDDPERDGIYLYHENPDWRFANQLGTPYRLSAEVGDAAWRSIKAGDLSGRADIGEGRLLFYRTYAPYVDRGNRWLLVIEVARDTVLAPVAELRSWIGYLIAAMLILGVLVARWAAARLARPVHELAQIITRYADGEREVRYRDDRADEIGVAGRAFNYLSESLERAQSERDKAEQAVRQSERLAAVGQMAAGIGHEINNPLMNIMSLATLIEDSLPRDSGQAREDITALRKEGNRCARIVQGILNFARETRPTYQRFDLAALIEETVALFAHRMEKSAITPQTRLQRPLMMEGDANQLQQVLVNVILNAIQASPEGSAITISAEQEGGLVRVQVLDRGSGAGEEALSKAFNPFFTTKPEGSGTGLGLSVSYGIVRKHGGTISLRNREERGVCVKIVLPIAGHEGAEENEVSEVSHAR